MTIKRLLDSYLFDEFEQVVILSQSDGNGYNNEYRHFTGYISMIPKKFYNLEIELVSAMGDTRRSQYHLNKYGWTEIWIDDDFREYDD
jgi:hypothetical protein